MANKHTSRKSGKAIGRLAKAVGATTPGGVAGLGALLIPGAISAIGAVGNSLSGRQSRREVAGALEGPSPWAAQARAEKVKRLMMVNEARLAVLKPTLYQELAAGRRLPRGAVVIGGGQRRDLIEEAAFLMSRLPPPGQGGIMQQPQTGNMEALLGP